MNHQVARLLAGKEDNLQQWFHRARAVLETRMEHEIKVCLALAAKAIRDFPTNRYTRMLHAASLRTSRPPDNEVVRPIKNADYSELIMGASGTEFHSHTQLIDALIESCTADFI